MKAILKETGDLLLIGDGQTQTIAPEHHAYGRLMRLYAGRTSLSANDEPKAEEGYGGHPWADGTPIPGEVYQVPVEAIEVDPERLQYKRGADEETGVVTPWEGEFDPERMGELSVWKHKGKTKLVDGHHRFHEAKKAGMEEVPCKYIEATNEAEAKAIGKHINGYRELAPKEVVSLSFSGDVVSEAVRALRERFSLGEYDDISLSNEDQPRDDAGRWKKIIGDLKSQHPMPVSMDSPVNDLHKYSADSKEPEIVKKKNDYAEARKQYAEYMGKVHRARTVHTMDRLLHGKRSEDSPISEDDDLKKRLRVARRAIERADNARSDHDFFSIFSNHGDEVANSHPQGGEAIEAARAIAKEKAEMFRREAIAHINRLPENQRKLAMKELGEYDA